MWYYKTAFRLDQNWSIRMAGARQRHIDQGQSFNLYVRPDIRAVDFLNLHLHAWKAGLKSTYYVRSQALTVEECEACRLLNEVKQRRMEALAGRQIE